MKTNIDEKTKLTNDYSNNDLSEITKEHLTLIVSKDENLSFKAYRAVIVDWSEDIIKIIRERDIRHIIITKEVFLNIELSDLFKLRDAGAKVIIEI